MDTLNYCKVREVKSPNRAHSEDAGIDFYFSSEISIDEFNEKCNITKSYPNYTTENGFITSITLQPFESVLLPSGLCVKIPHGHALIFFNKSGVASKKHLQVGACVIDENYQSECHINLTNVGNSSITIYANDKIVQGIVLPINYCTCEEIIDINHLYDNISDRGGNGFGSTDKI
jgi:dUTP pyrophosphatase